MANENAPLSRKEEEEKKAAEQQMSSGLISGKTNSTYGKWMNKYTPGGTGSMFKKKAKVSQPGDASEIQADAVAKAVTEGNANAAQVELQNEVCSGEITAKANDVSIETPPGFEEQLEKMKGGGLPLPDDKKANLEEMLGADLDHVRLHTGSDAAELSDQINALAFATGDDIFYPGDLNDEELLAHEVTHTLQGDNTVSASQVNRVPGDQLKTLHEAELFQLKNNTMVSAFKLLPETKLVELYYEYTDQTNTYYYVFVKLPDQKTVTGFIKQDDVELLPNEPVIIDPEKDKTMREGIRYNTKLTQEQSDYFNWPAVSAVFRALPGHARVNNYYLDQWARKQLKAGWRLTDPVPDLTAYRAEFGEKKIYAITGEPVPTLYVYWYSENQATIRHQLLDKNKHNYKGFWVFVDSITGYESELQQNDSFGKFYLANPVSAMDMTNLFLYIADRKIVVEHTQADIQVLGVDSEAFRIVVEKVQDVLYNGIRISGYGMYTLQSRKLVNDAVALIKQKEQEELQREILAYNQQPLAEIPLADKDLVILMSSPQSEALYTLRNDLKFMEYINSRSDNDDPTYGDKVAAKRTEYESALAVSPFKSADVFEKNITSLQNAFQRRALTVANNILNNTQNLIVQERYSYFSKPSRLEDMAVLLYEAKVEYEQYLADRWEADKMDHVMQQNESYSFKGELNDNDYMAIASLQRAMNEVAKVRDAGHPLLDYFIQPGRADELGQLLGYSYYAGYNYLQARNNQSYKNPYRTKFAVSMGMAEKVEAVNTAPLYSTIAAAVSTMSGNIDITRQNLLDSPKKVWDLDNVVAFTFDDMGLMEGSASYKMVNEELQRRQSIKMFKEIFLTVCNIGLGILACSGIGTPFAILAGLGAAAISTYQYFDHKADYEFQKAASGTGTSGGTSLLSSEPDAFWLYLDLLGAGIDVFAALKIIAAVGKTAKLFKLADVTEEAATKARLLDELDNALRTNVAKQADELIIALRKQLDDIEHVADIRAKDYTVNEIKGKIDAVDKPKVYEKAELNRFVANAEQIGDVKVWRGKEAEKFLDTEGANAMYLPGEAGQPGALVLRDTASRNVIMEELLHLEQHRMLNFKEMEVPEMLKLEIEAQDALLRYGKNNNWTADELAQIERNKQYWLDEQVKVNADKEYAADFESRMKGLKNVDQRDYDRISKAAYYFAEEGKTSFDDFLTDLKAGKRVKGADKMDLTDPDIEKAFNDGIAEHANKAPLVNINSYSGNIVQKYIKPSDLNTNVGSKYPWTGPNEAPQWENPYSVKAYGHIPAEHGPRLKSDYFKNKLGSTNKNQGQFYDEMIWIEAEKLIDPQPGYYLIKFDKPIGRIYLTDGNIVSDVHQMFLRRNRYGLIKFGFPVLDTQTFDELFKINKIDD